MAQDTDALLAERATTHGKYEDHAGVTQALKRVMESSPNYAGLPDIYKESLAMFAHKIARILTGNAFVHDHFDDICGYARLITQRVEDGIGLKPEVAEVAERYAETSGEVLRKIKGTLQEVKHRYTEHGVWRAVERAGESANQETVKIYAKHCPNASHKERVLVARRAHADGKRDGALIQHVGRRCGVKWGEAAAVCRELGLVAADKRAKRG